MTEGPANPTRAPAFGEDDVPERGEAGRYSTVSGIGQHRHVEQAGIGKPAQPGADLGHLHQRVGAFLHAGSAGLTNDNQGAPVGDRPIYQARDFFSCCPAHASEDVARVHDSHSDVVDYRIAAPLRSTPLR